MGWVYNLQTPDPDSHIPRVIAVSMVFAGVACLTVALRFHVRIWVKKAVWVDDFAALFSALMAVGYAGLIVAQTRWGLGLHEDYFPAANSIPFAKMQYAGGPVYAISLLGFRISLLASYLRIGGFVRTYRMVIVVAILACVCNQIAFGIVISCGCRPVARQWDPSIPGTCIDTVASYYALAATSLAFDVVIIALPLPILAKLKLRLRQKVLLGVLFGLGFFITIIQIIRIFTVKNLATYANSEAIILWSIVEIGLGVIISCIPTYGPYFRSFKMNISGYRRRRTQGTGQYYGSSDAQSRLHSQSNTQSYRLSSRNMSRGRTGGRDRDGDRVYDNSTVPTTTVGAVAERNRMGDNDSEEIILFDREDDGAEQIKDTGNGKGIHIATEVRVERE
ncbi:putative integral membrane protein (Pth11) [Aspergillus puulaauensis]|uniref:Rhodopsin domain-containing protein n=1 Tax=Aspergillus puulaauensis TaxID=1220207 RepID=A0A7R7XL81_9EURO|nr:uncharacterized protein APUU_40010A [Aspergillus puulaauensis]BCS23566.1 hypothetical protein APUU_40010A [Aspergillus puulaauensis]